MIDAFGWTWEYIDEEVTLPRLDAIIKHWQQVPPLSVSAAAIASALGVGPAAKREKKTSGEQDPSALLEMLGASGFASEKPKWLNETATKST